MKKVAYIDANGMAQFGVPPTKPVVQSSAQQIMAATIAASNSLFRMLDGSDTIQGLQMVRRRSESEAGKELIAVTKAGHAAALKAIADEVNDA